MIDETLGMHRIPDHTTSIAAAEAILPHRQTIRQKVERFARACGGSGFIDEQLEDTFPHWAPSSWRTRRSELVKANVLLDSGFRRRNTAGREMIVWVHRDYHPDAPPVVESKQGLSLRAEHAEMLELLRDIRKDGALTLDTFDRMVTIIGRHA